jgi:hypothetical protein
MKFKEYNNHPMIISATSYEGLELEDLEEFYIFIDPIVDNLSEEE